MAKHSLGKHGKGKHAAKAPAGAHASVPERTAEAAAPEEPAAGSQQADDAASDAGETAALTPPLRPMRQGTHLPKRLLRKARRRQLPQWRLLLP